MKGAIPMQQDALSLMNKKYNQLTNAEKKVADYVFANKESVQYMTITTLAKESDVAEATIFRFSKSLGFSGYNDFKLSLAKSMVPTHYQEEGLGAFGSIKPEDSFNTMKSKIYNTQDKAIKDTLENTTEAEINTVVSYFSRAKRVYFLGQGGSLIMAMEAWSRFLSIDNKFYNVQDNHQQAMAVALLEPGDCVCYFSYSGATRDVMELIAQAKSKGVNFVLVTGFPQSPAGQQADIVLHANTKEGPLEMGSLGSKAAQLFLIELIFSEYYRSKKIKMIDNMEETSRAITRKML